MWFNSIEFALFMVVVFTIFWFVLGKSKDRQNVFLLIASYFFYGCWDWRFLFLIVLSSSLDYIIGLRIFESKSLNKRKFYIAISLIINLGLLFYFKYFNFFIDSFVEFSELVGLQANRSTLNIILPVGISFYTFQTLSYTIDIHRKQLEPTRNIIAFFTFVSFFPQLVAGPIERAASLLPQFLRKREFDFDKAKDGMKLVLYGLFKKIVIADNCAIHVNEIFENYDSQDGSVLLLGAILFAMQIYCDFSGYSDIAIGISKILGFDLTRNFAYPYFSRNIAEFWRRWHISLSSWFRDYVFIPLGGSRVSKALFMRNIIITFSISGLWHGANWTYLIWGFLNGIYYLPVIFSNKAVKHKNIVAHNRLLPSIGEFLQIGITFFLTIIAWTFFRSENVTDAFGYLQILFSPSLFIFPSVHLSFLPIVFVFLVFEWIQREKVITLEMGNTPKSLRIIIYSTLTILIALYQVKDVDIEFIYFQF